MIETPAQYQALLTWSNQLNAIITGGDTSICDVTQLSFYPGWALTNYNAVQAQLSAYVAAGGQTV